MLEILALYTLTTRIGAIVEQKGHKSGSYKLMTVALWFGGEIFGAIIGSLMAGGGESAQCVIYIVALIGAGAGAGIAFAIANNLPVVGPSLATGMAQPAVASSIGLFPAPLLWFLWLLTNAVANVGWGLTFNLINPNYQENLLSVASIASGITAGTIAGVLQWILLFLSIRNANRLSLAVWIPASMIGWAIGAAAFDFITVSSSAAYLALSIASGLVIGALQWLVLRNYSRIALWWIAANAADWALIWLVNQTSWLYNLPSFVLYNFVAGLIASIISGIAIVVILRNAHAPAAEELWGSL